jgi:hypothetical protein
MALQLPWEANSIGVLSSGPTVVGLVMMMVKMFRLGNLIAVRPTKGLERTAGYAKSSVKPRRL